MCAGALETALATGWMWDSRPLLPMSEYMADEIQRSTERKTISRRQGTQSERMMLSYTLERWRERERERKSEWWRAERWIKEKKER